MISIHDLAAVDIACRRHKIEPEYLRRVRNAFYKKRLSAQSALGELPGPERLALAGQIDFHALDCSCREDSRLDGASKLVFRTADDLAIEAVILRMTSGRTALCVSTQVGCAAACDFCATGKMRLTRNLSVAEILDQLVRVNQMLAVEGRQVRNLVFMGMGEPFHNEAELLAAIDVLADSRAFNLNLKRVMVSTVGIPAAMIRCARRFPDVRLALSLHSARQDVRRRLMPISQRYSLAELRAALDEVSAIAGHLVMVEYLMLKDVNDSREDAESLIEYLRGASVHVNLIPYNPIAESPHLAPSEPSRREAFSRMLKAAGFPVTTRYSLGSDIAAACGQLARQELSTARLARKPGSIRART
jgi:23S rRNA (adenine2503-C2)-methyltransferase